MNRNEHLHKYIDSFKNFEYWLDTNDLSLYLACKCLNRDIRVNLDHGLIMCLECGNFEDIKEVK